MKAEERTALYRLFNAEGDLLYVGISKNPRKRWGQHALEKPWWHEIAEKTVEWHPDRATAEALETQAIVDEKPAYDQTARRYVHPRAMPPRLEFDYSAEQARVVELVTRKIQSGDYPPGKLLQGARIGREYGVSASIGRDALDTIQQQSGLVRHDIQGRYRVQADPVPTPVFTAAPRTTPEPPRLRTAKIPLGDADATAQALRKAMSAEELAALAERLQVRV
ncbi:GIY-YIG nuclease family protein [Streptomyces sp. KN37]|uniref:GIY-YIG nuclease family protein n=1 Tax=Streptomyces sp. KN37 TaxID=3090667 RepID=UPI002A74E2B0|nr:GIY-YIG nuclease family protein [Streptomyces sp. KN37]WPO69947.1 GIY-YIG nuclease family protein [Streptomyces sp. KN37]